MAITDFETRRDSCLTYQASRHRTAAHRLYTQDRSWTDTTERGSHRVFIPILTSTSRNRPRPNLGRLQSVLGTALSKVT
jgi:hypothetical protein